MINAGEYNKKIRIFTIEKITDDAGFDQKPKENTVLEPYAKVKTTKGFTLITNNTDFEKAYTNFTIRCSKKVEDSYYNSNRKMYVEYKKQIFTIEYLNNVDEENIEIEMQCKRITK